MTPYRMLTLESVYVLSENLKICDQNKYGSDRVREI